MKELDEAQLGQINGGLLPLALAASLVTSKSFSTFATAVTLIGVAAEIGTAIIESD